MTERVIDPPTARPLDRPTDITLESHKIDRRREGGRKGRRGRKYNTDTAWHASFLDQRLRDASSIGDGTISKLRLHPKCAAVMDGSSVTPLTVQNKREMANGKVGGVLAFEIRGLLDKLSTRKSPILYLEIWRREGRGPFDAESMLASPDATRGERRRVAGEQASTVEGDRDLRGARHGRTNGQDGPRRRQNAFGADERARQKSCFVILP